jgi:hypothetical protein
MRSLVGVLILATLAAGSPAACQEDHRIQDLLRKLDDDSIEARASAAAALIGLGKAALPALRRGLAGAGVELKDRLGEIIRKIQDRERLATLLPPLSRITLSAKDRPLREVLEKVTKQTATAIDYSEVPEEVKVTVALDRVPLWKALDQICRASGKVMPEIRSDHVAVVPEPYVELPGRMTDLFSVTLQRIELSTEVTFGSQERYDQFTARLQVAWGKGARPYYLAARLAELVDAEGNQLIAPHDELEPAVRSFVGPEHIGMDITLPSSRGPGPQATKISKLHVEVEFEFPLKYAETKIDLSGGKTGGSAECPEFAVRLHKFERQEGNLTALLVMAPKGPLEGELQSDAVVLRDKGGKEYGAIVTEGSQGNENETPFQLAFPTAPDNVEYAELQIRLPTEVHRERIDVVLKDLSLK